MRMSVKDLVAAALAPLRRKVFVRGARRAGIRRALFAPEYRTVAHEKWVPGKPDPETGEPRRVKITRLQVVRKENVR